MAKQVKTYRVLREPQNVGDSVRMFGDLIPEASGFPNLRSYLNSNVIEEIWVDQSVIDEFYKELEERQKQKAKEVEDEDEDETDPEEDEVKESPKPKKRVAKKTTVKKKTTTRKKADSSDKQLEERSV